MNNTTIPQMQVIIEGLIAMQSERLQCQESFAKQYKEMWANGAS